MFNIGDRVRIVGPLEAWRSRYADKSGVVIDLRRAETPHPTMGGTYVYRIQLDDGRESPFLYDWRFVLDEIKVEVN